MNLSDYRNQIDEIDDQVVDLISRRMHICEQVAQYKIENNMRVLDKSREQDKIRTLTAKADNEINAQAVRELYEQIMSISRRRQYQLLGENNALHKLPFIPVDHLVDKDTRVVYQGAEGSYSEAAMKHFFGEEIANFPVATFREAMTAVEEGSADYAVLPLENSTAGIVSQVYDLLVEFENYIVGEQVIPIEHCLMGVPGTNEDTVQTVYSHAQSLMQSERYLSEHGQWRQISMQNNAFAAQKVAADKDITEAAIASEYAAKRYGLTIIRRCVNQAENNSTRFIICTNQKIFKKDAHKVSIVFEILHESGSLYRLLSHIIYNNLNMTKIESRPIEDRTWEYRFFVDFEGNLADSSVRNALRGIRDEARMLKILGNY